MKKFANWVRTNFQKEETMKILFSNEKYFDIDGIYDSKNDRVRAVNRIDADEKNGVKERIKTPAKSNVLTGRLLQDTLLLLIANEGTVDHAVYIEKVLSVALKYENQVFGSDRIFHSDDAKSHAHHLTRRDHFLSFIDSNYWPTNTPDLNLLDYTV